MTTQAAYFEQFTGDDAIPTCACGNAPVLAGYRVCGDCKAAREQYPHVFADEATDESESER